MNPLLLSEISTEQLDPIKVLLLLEEYIFEKQVNLSHQFEHLVEFCQQAISTDDDDLVKVQNFLETIFIDLLFVDLPLPQNYSLENYQLASALAYRKIAPALKLIIIQELAKKCGLTCDVVFIPKSLMIRIVCDHDYAVIFEPVTGEALDWQTLDQRITDIEGDPESIALDGESNKVLLRNYLLALKSTLIREQKFQAALRCVDVLLAIKPDDPLERRDRGFLFHQLDCFKVACDDYRYFVEQCPEDPAAQLLKIQLDNIHIENIVLH
jgi:regulator of sirC expression with transglutaminase-like and TPR domain